MSRQALFVFSAALLISTSLSGCTKPSNGRVPIQGFVTLEGEPIKVGSISFRPVKGGSGLTSGADIQDGKFTIPAKTGPTIGTYSARVTIVSTGDGRARLGGMKTIEAEIEISAEKRDYEIELSGSSNP